MGGHQPYIDEIYTDDSTPDGYFILRLIDILADHTEPLAPTADERFIADRRAWPRGERQREEPGESRTTGMPPGQAPSLWRQTTPQEFLREIHTAHGKASAAEIRRRIKQALKEELLDDALFLVLAMARLPQYRREERDRVPWGG